MRRLVFLVLAGTLAGCAALAVQPEDGFPARAGKFAVRIPLAFVSHGGSEAAIRCADQPGSPRCAEAQATARGMVASSRTTCRTYCRPSLVGEVACETECAP